MRLTSGRTGFLYKAGFLAAVAGVSCLLAAMLFGPQFSPAEFDWLRHTTSEQAGQSMPGAWIMRIGFAGFGLGIVCAAFAQIGKRTAVRIALGLFGAGMIGAAIWSNAPIIAGMPFNRDEDGLHSLASAWVGTAFAAACAASLFTPEGSRRDYAAWLGLMIAIAIPLAMNLWPEWRGLMQRLMFLYSCGFILREFVTR